MCLFTLINGVNVSAASTDSNCTVTKPSVNRSAISGSEDYYDGSINTENMIEISPIHQKTIQLVQLLMLIKY